MADDDNLTRRDARRVAAERSRRRSPSVEDLRALVDYWDSVYDGEWTRSDDRKTAAADHFGWSVRTLDDRLRQAKRAGLSYRGMRP